MPAQSTIDVKELTITETDFDQLSELVNATGYRTSPADLLAGLRRGLRHGKIVAPVSMPRGVVTMNSQVRVRDLDSKESRIYTLSYPAHADYENGHISVLAPLGTALLGSRLGQVIEFGTPGGRRRLKVIKILYQPEAWGHFHR